jgi:acyl carrier protein
MENIINQLEKYIRSNFPENINASTFNPDVDLLEQGIIDSLGVMSLLTFIEEEFGLIVPDEDIIPENFQSIRDLAQFIHGKKNG